jgi:hypothetical protein
MANFVRVLVPEPSPCLFSCAVPLDLDLADQNDLGRAPYAVLHLCRQWVRIVVRHSRFRAITRRRCYSGHGRQREKSFLLGYRQLPWT